MFPNCHISVKHAKWQLSAMAAADASQSTLEQIMQIMLFYTNYTHAILIPLITYWCVLINVSNSTAVFGYFPWDFPASRVIICYLYSIILYVISYCSV